MVFGSKMYMVTKFFNNMRGRMELCIKEFPNSEVINTTKGGANIEGTAFMELEEVMNKYLKAKVVEENWLEGNKTKYDREYLKSQFENMDRALNRAKKLIEEYHDMLNKIERLINNRNFNEVEKKYVELDKVFGKLEKNKFFITFILPMNRVQYKILADSIDNLNAEKNPAEKGRKVIDSFRGFIDLCNGDINMIESMYEEMKEEIRKFL